MFFAFCNCVASSMFPTFSFCVLRFLVARVCSTFSELSSRSGFPKFARSPSFLGASQLLQVFAVFPDVQNPLRIRTPGGIPFWRAVHLPEETFECGFTSMHRLLTEDLEKLETTYIPKSGGTTPEVLCSQICFSM